MNINDLINSYSNTISKMDLISIKPYTETEIQPLYSDLWIEDINCFIEQNLEKINISLFFDIQNYSIFRSMFIMDIFDLYYSNSNENIKTNFKKFYLKILKLLYSDDCFSLKKNIPLNFINQDYFKIQNNKQYNKINIGYLEKELFKFSYKYHYDIYADNCYELIGPFYKDNKVLIKKLFHTNIGCYCITIISDNYISGSIDLFGHSDIIFRTYDVYVDKNNIPLNDYEIQNEILLFKHMIIFNNNNLKLQMFLNRYKRFKKLFDKLGYNFKNYDNIIKRISNQEIKQRIIDKNLLINMINYIK